MQNYPTGVGGQEPLRLTNRLSESRSPYVRAHCSLGTTNIIDADRSHPTGPRTHEQSRRVAGMDARSFGAGEEAQQAAVREHWICGMPLYYLPIVNGKLNG
jgi:hypothetical protein